MCETCFPDFKYQVKWKSKIRAYCLTDMQQDFKHNKQSGKNKQKMKPFRQKILWSFFKLKKMSSLV